MTPMSPNRKRSPAVPSMPKRHPELTDTDHDRPNRRGIRLAPCSGHTAPGRRRQARPARGTHDTSGSSPPRTSRCHAGRRLRSSTAATRTSSGSADHLEHEPSA
jgi:hypothetical protein